MGILSLLKLTIAIALFLECIILLIIEIGLLRAAYRGIIKATDALMMTTLLISVPTLTIALYIVVMKIEGGLV